MTFSNCFRNLTNTFQKLSVHRLCQLRYHQSYIFIPSPIHSSDAYPPALPPNYGWIQPIIYFVYVLLFVMLLETYPRNLTQEEGPNNYGVKSENDHRSLCTTYTMQYVACFINEERVAELLLSKPRKRESEGVPLLLLAPSCGGKVYYPNSRPEEEDETVQRRSLKEGQFYIFFFFCKKKKKALSIIHTLECFRLQF